VEIAIKTQNPWEIVEGSGPIIAAAIHDGHAVREELLSLIALSEADRLHEEDPHTSVWASVAPSRIIGKRSRFEVDLNRPREKAVYQVPEDAWGLKVWHEPLQHDLLERSLEEYDQFYSAVGQLLDNIVQREGRAVVYDLHTYNHHRAGPDAPYDDPSLNPQVNLGTGTMDRSRWAAVVDRFLEDLHEFDFPGGRLDVRENVKFRGGNFGKWIHEYYPDSVCVLSIEFKKFFMDEWTGVAEEETVGAIKSALESTLPGAREELAKL